MNTHGTHPGFSLIPNGLSTGDASSLILGLSSGVLSSGGGITTGIGRARMGAAAAAVRINTTASLI